jgi:hypothetical protein
VKNWSAHFIFDENFQWKSLEKCFIDLFNVVKGDRKNTQEEEQVLQVRFELNMREIRNNKKPIGFRSDETELTMIFPIDRKEMIISHYNPSEMVTEAAEKISKVLKTKKIKFSLEFDRMKLIEVIRNRR